MENEKDYTYFPVVDATVAEAAEGTITSRVIYKDAEMNVTLFAFAAGQGLTEHTAARAAIVHFLEGRARFSLSGETLEVGPGAWIRMRPGLPHSVEAITPVKMLLTLL